MVGRTACIYLNIEIFLHNTLALKHRLTPQGCLRIELLCGKHLEQYLEEEE